MTKSSLVSFIEKYHLGGMVEKVCWEVHAETARIQFVSDLNSTAGHITFPFIDMGKDPQKFGIYSTSSLLKMLNVMQEELNISFLKEHGIFMNMEVNDGVYDGLFSLADLGSIPPSPNIEEPTVYEVSFLLDKDFKEQYLKAYRALGSINRFTIEAGKSIKITLGNKESYSNKLSFNKTSDDYLPLKPKSFSGEAVAEILKNNKDLSDAEMYISEEGLMKIRINDKENNSGIVYYIVELEEL